MTPKVVVRAACLMLIAFATGAGLLGIEGGLWQAAAISLATIVLWATGALPEDQTTLLFFVSASLVGLVGPEVIFAGFTTSAFWLVFGGLVIGAAVKRSGMDRVIAAPLMPWAARSYGHAVAVVVVMSFAMCWVVPSNMTRMILAVPVVMAMCDALGLKDGRGRHGLIVIAVLASYYFGVGILPANVPNVTLAGSLEKTLHIHLHFADYFVTYFPVLGLLKTILASVLIVAVFRVSLSPQPSGAGLQGVADGDHPSASSAFERKVVAIVLVCALAFWITDFWHGISPAWIALMAAIIFMFPGINVVPPPQFGTLVNIRPALFVAGILGLGNFIAASGLGVAAAHFLAGAVGLHPDGAPREIALMTGISATLGLLATHPGMAAMLPSLTPELTKLSGLSADTIVGTIVAGYSVMLLPYQVPPSIIGFQLAGMPHRIAVGATLLIGLATALVTLPLQFLWWRFLGL